MPATDPQIVATPARMERFLVEIAHATELAVDTEANPMHAYREKLCLIQVSSADGDYLIDPLAPIDLGPFLDILADPHITKIFHDAEFDILQLKKRFEIGLRGLFDTKVAAVAAGEPEVGLAALVARHFDVKLDKTKQRSNWGRRPLEPAQIEYAILDVHYLRPLAAILRERIGKMDPIVGREVESECRRLERLRPPLAETDGEGWLRLKGASRLQPRELRLLFELWAWREAEAERRDVPPFKVLGNNSLVAIAKSGATTVDMVARSRTVNKALLRRWRRELDSVLRAAARKPGLERPAGAKLSGEERRRMAEDRTVLERLKRWRKAVADARNTDPSLVLNREVLEALAAHRPRPRCLEDLLAFGLLEDWRVAAHGNRILAAIGEGEEE